MVADDTRGTRHSEANGSSEMKLAGEVQRLLLPKTSPQCSWCCMAARNQMANVLGGDFYEFIRLDDGCQVVCIGDVTGHGLHASVVMSLVYGFIHRGTREGCNPHDIVTDLNAFLRMFARRSALLDHYFSATLFLGVIAPETLTMHYVNAGHPAALVKRREALFRLPATSHPTGYFDAANFTVESFPFEKGDRLLLYTDGLLDCPNPDGEMFGTKRLEEAFRRLDSDPVVLLDQLFNVLAEFQAGQPAFDDSTAIIIDLYGKRLQG